MNIKKQQKYTFQQFLSKFPIIDLPVTLGEDTHHDFSQQNDPLPQGMVSQYISEWMDMEDEYTEYVPCFRLKDTGKFAAIIIWKASMLNYQYHLLTYTEKGDFIHREIIASTSCEGSVLKVQVAMIDPDWVIHTMTGIQNDLAEFDAHTSQSSYREILADGTIYTPRDMS